MVGRNKRIIFNLRYKDCNKLCSLYIIAKFKKNSKNICYLDLEEYVDFNSNSNTDTDKKSRESFSYKNIICFPLDVFVLKKQVSGIKRIIDGHKCFKNFMKSFNKDKSKDKKDGNILK